MIISVLLLVGIISAYLLYDYRHAHSDSNDYIGRWFNDRSSRAGLMTFNDETCNNAPFLLPSPGFIGLLWKDAAAPYNALRRHPGIDIFGDGQPGEVPVIAAYDGYLSRLDGWLSTVIIRHDDPLQPGRTIWTYYTHMADRDGSQSFVVDDFPQGTHEVFVQQGTLLGYQGEYNGAGVPVGLHVHMSIVTTGADGSFKNESVFSNTLDPSPYFGLPLNIDQKPERPLRCQ